MRAIGLRVLAMISMVSLFAAARTAVPEDRSALYMEDGVYRIECFEALEELSQLIAETEGAFAGEVWLMCDIEAARPLTPIGSPEHMFNGIFDGRGYAISGLVLDGDGVFQGLFGYIGADGCVRDLTLSDIRSVGTRYTGGVAGYCAGTLTDCTVIRGRIAGKSPNEYSVATGGVVGLSCGQIIRCVNLDAQVLGGRYVGGVVGSQCAGRIEGCLSSGNVYSRDRGQALAGGVVGGVQTGGEIRNCIGMGRVYASNASWAGGVAGGLLSGRMANCLSIREVCGREAGGVTGFAARRAQVINCHYSSRISVGVGEGRQTGTSMLPGSRLIRIDPELLLPLIS